MPVSKHRKNRHPGPKLPNLGDFLAGHATYEFRKLKLNELCQHCGRPATQLVTVRLTTRSRTKAWPVPSCAVEVARLRKVEAWVQSVRDKIQTTTPKETT